MPAKRQFRQMGARVPDVVHRKADELLRDIRPLGKPRAIKDDLVGALISGATPESVVKALNRYDRQLGEAINELDSGGRGG
jgi:hypothetical protein